MEITVPFALPPSKTGSLNREDIALTTELTYSCSMYTSIEIEKYQTGMIKDFMIEGFKHESLS